MSEREVEYHRIVKEVELGIGTWAWGDQLYWGYRQGYNDQDLKAAFLACLDAGITFFDTAEVYGQGISEKILGKFLKETDRPIQVATKFMPFPWRLTGKALSKALRASLSRLGRTKVELYQMHTPFPPIKIETWMRAMVEAAQDGLIEAVGVSNYDETETQRGYDVLQREGIQLASNQVEYHLLNRKIEKNGLLKICKALSVKVIAYSPLAQGMLTGKYTQENPPRGFRSQRYNRKYLKQVYPLVLLLKKIGADHGGKNSGQVALNWCICKDTLPIPGVKNIQQAEQNCGAAGWRLSDAEVEQLDQASDQVLKEG
jgi:aryl-alcohol dehydrogenase-like predicted oxidoreductase